ncbi:MAG: transposase [Acidobacteriota bacterium]
MTSRGNEKQAIYLQDADRRRFLARLEQAHEERHAVIHAYCLMENHYHLILETPRGNLSEILHFINTTHSIYFNARHGRCGHLFQGRFKSVLVEAETYMQELARYVHLNPVRARIVDLPDQYRWSSYRDFVGLRPPPAWLHLMFVLCLFGESPDAARKRFADFVLEGTRKAIRNPLERADPRSILGSESFVERIKQTCLLRRESEDREVPDLRRLRRRPDLGGIRAEAERIMGPKNRFSRDLAIFLSHRCTDFRLKEIGDHFGLGISSISQICNKMKKDVCWNAVLARAVDELESKLRTLGGKAMSRPGDGTDLDPSRKLSADREQQTDNIKDKQGSGLNKVHE